MPGLIAQGLAFGLIGAGVATATTSASGASIVSGPCSANPLSVISAQVVGQILEQILGMVIVMKLGGLVGAAAPTSRPRHRPELADLSCSASSPSPGSACSMGMIVRSSTPCRASGSRSSSRSTFLAGTFTPSWACTVPRAIGEWDPLAALVAAMC